MRTGRGSARGKALRKRRSSAQQEAARPVRSDVSRDLEVWKFGGASLADAAAVQKAASLITRHDSSVVVVASAFAGVTDLLLDGAHASATGKPNAAARVAAELLRRHRQVVRAIVAA